MKKKQIASLIAIAIILVVLMVSYKSLGIYPSIQVIATATATAEPTPLAILLLKEPPQNPSDFWEKYGVIATVSSAIISLIFGALVRPITEQFFQNITKSITRLFSDFKNRYLRKIIEENKVLNIRGVKTEIPARPELERIYVSLRTYQRGADLTKEVDLDMQDLLPKYKRLAIIGEAGCGKSTMLSFIALTFSRGTQEQRLGYKKQLLPIAIQLRTLAKFLLENRLAITSLGKYLDFSYKELGMDPPPDFFEKYLRNGDCIVLLDGLDEVASETERVFLSEWVDQQVSIYPENTFIISSRIEGYERAELKNNFFVLKIRSFQDNEIETFCKNWYLAMEIIKQGEDNITVQTLASQNATNLITAIQQSSAIRKLAVNPLMLSIIAIVHSNRTRLPQRRVELYEECLDVLLGYWDEAKGLPLSLRPNQKLAVLRPIALAMHNANQRVIDQTSILSWFEVQLPKVGVDGREAELFLKEIKERSGVLLEYESNEFAFSHLSFQEYLAALEISKIKDEKFLLPHAEETWWHEVIQLYAGVIDATNIISGLLNSNSLTQLILAGKCLVDAEQVESAIREKVINKLKSILPTSNDNQFFQIGNLLADTTGKDMLSFFIDLSTAYKSSNEKIDWIIESIVRLSQQQDENTRLQIQKQLMSIYLNENNIYSNTICRVALESLHWMSDDNVLRFLLDSRCPNDMVIIPSGQFYFGSNKDIKQIALPTFFIGKNLVTNKDYNQFIADSGYLNSIFWTEQGWKEKTEKNWNSPAYWKITGLNNPDKPVVGISWHEATAYCNWLAKKTNLPYRLPTELEWEKAARGKDKRIYPWGDIWDNNKCNSMEAEIGTTSIIGLYSPIGDSPYGLTDMSGNVWEWCLNTPEKGHDPYHTKQLTIDGLSKRAERGGSYKFHRDAATVYFRDSDFPSVRVEDKGFRCCIST